MNRLITCHAGRVGCTPHWIADQVRNDGIACHAGLDPASMTAYEHSWTPDQARHDN
jgi:hypothetical protein